MSVPEQPNVAFFTGTLATSPFARYTGDYSNAITDAADTLKHGDLTRWRAALDALKALGDHANLTPAHDDAAPGARGQISADLQARLEVALRELMPWRKGPFAIGPTHIDSEWQSNRKWDRIAPHLDDLSGRTVLDVGGGNGYFSWRLAGHGAAAVLNIDPTLLFYAQHLAIAHFIDCPAVAMLPLTLERLPMVHAFDTVLSMGVLYHRRSPIDHLTTIRQHLRPGGQLVLETLVVPGDETTCLTPHDRYARMRNVWFLPSSAMLTVWLARAGFTNMKLVDETITTVEEQRPSDWMPFESLAHALDPSQLGRTIEGLPAPLRAILVAERS